MNMATVIRGAKFAAVILGMLAVAGCAKQADQSGALASAATPGSQQDFVVNVGDRVFFETDSSELTDQARATLDKQAQWLNQYNRYAFTIEGHADEGDVELFRVALDRQPHERRDLAETRHHHAGERLGEFVGHLSQLVHVA